MSASVTENSVAKVLPGVSSNLSQSSLTPQNDFGVVTSTVANVATGTNNIDALIADQRWTSNTVTFSFTDSFSNDYESGYPNSSVHLASFNSLSLLQQTVARSAMGQYEAVSGLNLVELTSTNDRNATVRIARSDHPGRIGAAAYAYLPSAFVVAGDIWFDNSFGNTPRIGNRSYRTFLHEIGHALGLEHGHEINGIANTALSSDRDSMEFSVMTYRSAVGGGFFANETWGFSQSLMMYDIAAIQAMYGANFNTNAGNTTYTFSTATGEMFINGLGQGIPGANRLFRTVWDGNGIDTYDFSNYTTNLAIDLTPGGWSDLDVSGSFQKAILQQASIGPTQYARGHVFNALQYNGDVRSLIENANGGSGNDTLNGNSTNNILQGNGGNDTLNGNDGDDSLYGHSLVSGGGLSTETNILNGGDGDDTLYGSDGIDSLNGGAGDDFIRGNGSNDTINGGSGIDKVSYFAATGSVFINLTTGFVSGADGTDTLTGIENLSGSNFSDSLTGDSSNNSIDGHDGNDSIRGAAGDDTLNGGNGNDNIRGDTGNDTINGGNGLDFLYGNSLLSGDGPTTETNIINGDDGNDFIYGSNGNDTINGGADNDLIRGNGGNDNINGGTGIDTVNYLSAASGVTANLSTGQSSGGDGNDTLTNIENLQGSNFNDILTGDSNANVMDGNGGNDSLRGGAGNDRLNGGTGNDSLYGNTLTTGGGLATETNSLNGGNGNDLIYGSDGNDIILGGNGNDFIRGNGGNDFINGGTGIDWASYFHATGSVTVNLTTGRSSGADGSDTLFSIESLSGSSFNDILTGNSNNNVINGNNGNDTVRGTDGNDTISGNDGDDILYGSSLTTGGGTATETNTLNGGAGDDAIYGADGNDIINGGTDDDFIRGNGGNDAIDGGAGNDWASYFYATGSVFSSLTTGTSSGADGNDTLSNIENLSGSSFSDTLFGDSNNNILDGNGGNDILNGDGGRDIVNGDAGNDSIAGDSGDDTLSGNAGNDILLGGTDNDTLLGGIGDDTLNGYGGGVGEIDILTGDLSTSQPDTRGRTDGADIFVLGNAAGAFYLGVGLARITDFFWGEGDKIQAYGNQSDYSLSVQNFTGAGSSDHDTLIFYQSDLIGVVQDTTNVILSADFIFV